VLISTEQLKEENRRFCRALTNPPDQRITSALLEFSSMRSKCGNWPIRQIVAANACLCTFSHIRPLSPTLYGVCKKKCKTGAFPHPRYEIGMTGSTPAYLSTTDRMALTSVNIAARVPASGSPSSPAAVGAIAPR
jgi:hypothetical protein